MIPVVQWDPLPMVILLYSVLETWFVALMSERVILLYSAPETWLVALNSGTW